MTSKVRILEDSVVNQIAAGEVVERPGSVVKELVENSIDAGAIEITVVIANGGQSLIEVIDNGCGMSRDDALLAVERFGTSKIRSVDDLLNISTLGFRGEALPSIASISRFSLATRLYDDSSGEGTELEIEGGILRNVFRRSMPPGTQIKARNLFYNVPARRKFLKSDSAEAALVKSQVIDLSAAHPNIRFTLVVDGQEVLLLNRADSFFDRVRQLRLGREDAIIFTHSRNTAFGPVEVMASLSQPLHAVAGAGSLRFLVNNRAVRDKLLLRAVRDGYANFIKPGRYPAGILSLIISPSEVDVNAHPQKAEVRFRDPGAVFGVIRSCVEGELRKLSPEQTFRSSFPSESTFNPSFGSGGDSWLNNPAKGAVTEAVFELPSDYQPGFQQTFFDNRGDSKDSNLRELGIDIRLSTMRYVGQVLQLYLLLEAQGVLAVVDMHAAHERIMFYRLKSQYLQNGVSSQLLLSPEAVTIPAEFGQEGDELLKDLKKLGIECEKFGEGKVIVRALPSLLGNVSAEALFRDIFSMDVSGTWGSLVENNLDAILARLACHSSVRSGRILKPEEVAHLLADLEQVESSAFCPHGRPVAVFIKEAELESMFGRRV